MGLFYYISVNYLKILLKIYVIDALKENWNIFSLDIWLFMSSFGRMFAVLSLIQDLGGLDEIRYPWIKGFLSIFLSTIFYYLIGIPHIYGASKINSG